MRFFPRLERVLLTFWVGGLWAIGYIAVPSLFFTLDDRQLAGELAGQMLKSIQVIGLACGLLLLCGLFYEIGRQFIRQWRCWLLLAMLLLTVLAVFIIQPMMVDLKAHGPILKGTELAAEFGRLHGMASVLYLLNSIMGLALITFTLRQK